MADNNDQIMFYPAGDALVDFTSKFIDLRIQVKNRICMLEGTLELKEKYINELEEVCDRYVVALREYANRQNWSMRRIWEGFGDGTEIARKALEEEK